MFGYAVNGVGMALQVNGSISQGLPTIYDSLQDAQANGFVASLKDNASAKMGMLHAAYGAFNICRVMGSIG